MGIFEAVVLGIVQAVTEFLPISSDGHLILVPSLLGWSRFGLGFDVALHAGTLLATVAYFRADVRDLAVAMTSPSPDRAADRRLAWMLIGATVPSVVVVLALESFVEGVERRPVTQQITISAWGLIVTTVTLLGSELIARRTRSPLKGTQDAASIGWPRALIVGFAQGFAALPGVSRSGTTIATAQALGLPRGEAARFSFLLSIPIVGAATVKKLADVLTGHGSLPPLWVTVAGVLTTTLVGYAVIHFLLPFVRRHSLGWFAAYTAIAGILLLTVYGTH